MAPKWRPAFGLLSAPGHTPGHSVLIVRRASDQLMISADTMYVPALLAPHPDWQGTYDQDGPTAIDTRRKLIDRVIADKMVICGVAFPVPRRRRIRQGRQRLRLHASLQSRREANAQGEYHHEQY